MEKNIYHKLKQGQTVYGTCIVSTSPVWPKAVAGCGLDFVFIDTEHTPIDRNELSAMCRIYNEMGLSPIVRIPSPDAFEACKAKDAGALGVVAPYVENAEQIRQLVGATKLRPLKGERLQNILSGKEEAEKELTDYLENYNRNSLSIVNIESKTAVERLDELLAVPGLDAVIIGPHDLSINLGIPEQYDHPLFEKNVSEIIKKARAHGVAAGIHFPGKPDRQIKWLKEGANIILHSSDLFLFNRMLKEDITEIKKSAGEIMQTTGGKDLNI